MSREREEESDEMVTAKAERSPTFTIGVDRSQGRDKSVTVLLNVDSGVITMLNRNQIARDSGLDRRHVGRIMLGQDRPRLDTAYRIATAMGVSLDQLYSLLSPLWAANREDR